MLCLSLLEINLVVVAIALALAGAYWRGKVVGYRSCKLSYLGMLHRSGSRFGASDF